MVKNVIYQTIIHSFESAKKECASSRHLLLQNDVSHGVRWCNVVFSLKDVTYSSKRLRYSPTFGGNSSVHGRKFEEAEDFKCIFVVYCKLESK